MLPPTLQRLPGNPLWQRRADAADRKQIEADFVYIMRFGGGADLAGEKDQTRNHMIIRPPDYEDVETLIELGSQLHRESAYSFLPYEPARVRVMITEYLKDRTSRCGLMAESGGAAIGMIGGVLIEYYFCAEKLVADEVLFVRPDRRGGLAAARLIEALEEWAIGQGARELCLSVSTGVNRSATGRLYEGLGFVPVGGVFKKRLDAAGATPG